MLSARNWNFQDILRVNREMRCSELLHLRWGESVCNIHVSNATHPEVTRKWVLLSDLVEVPPASQEPHRLIVWGMVPVGAYDRGYRRIISDQLLPTSDIQVPYSELESIKVTIIQHLFLFSSDDLLNGEEPQTGKIPINNLEGFRVASCFGTINVGHGQEMDN